MPNNSKRSTEHEISIAVLQYLATISSGEAKISQIKKHVPDFIHLTETDMRDSQTRPNERMWEQQVRNIVSHRNAEGNFIAEGLLTYNPDTLQITDAGRLYLRNRGY